MAQPPQQAKPGVEDDEFEEFSQEGAMLTLVLLTANTMSCMCVSGQVKPVLLFSTPHAGLQTGLRSTRTQTTQRCGRLTGTLMPWTINSART